MSMVMTDQAPQQAAPASLDKPWKPPTPAEVKDRWKEIQDDMIDLRRNYLLNSSFFHGDQWLRWDDSRATLNILDFADEDEAMTRATVNKLKPLVTSLLARLCKSPLSFEPRPEGVDSFAIQKARLARQILDVKAHRDGWSQTRRQALNFALLGGVSAIATEPAFHYDDPPISDGQGSTIKVPSRPAPKLTALAAPEFGLEPGTRDERDAAYWIRNTTLSPLQAKREYQLDYTPDADAEAAQGVMQRALRTNRRGSTNAKVCMVLVYYECPTDNSPGCVLHVLGDRIVRQSGWVFPFKELNVTTFTETEIGGTWKGDTRMNDARQIQVQINKAYTSINSNILRNDNNRMLLPDGAVMEGDDDVDGTPGQIIRYNNEVGKPEWMVPPDVSPRGLREHIQNLSDELSDLFSTHAVSTGDLTGQRTSGLTMSILAEKDETPLGLIAEDQQRGWQRVAEQVLEIERYLMMMVDKATMPTTTPDGQPMPADAQHPNPMQVTDVLMSSEQDQNQPGQEPKEVTWTADDISEHPVVHVPLDATMPRSQAAIQDAMIKLSQAVPTMFASLGPPELAKVFEVGNQTTFSAIIDPHREEANWENARMASGEDEETVMVAEWQPHALHIDEHNKFRATAGYRDADPAIKQFVDLHVQAHTTLLAEQVQQQQAEQRQAMINQAPPGPPQGEPPKP